ncbi:hypothetical protein [Novosphingobium cyanobacteriorum]|uniref:UrcA family protein n=1 Tax=Novosphingobium cyanobacteriorum TaxID=3024215 RepID=A0ABT6CM21_9SPHN|nr:hypothetical protein [Novosphingobium cyanobacteriorum]MDF8334110.1 hypothetical protein [Novosphingobium cyanobacteriorum]
MKGMAKAWLALGIAGGAMVAGTAAAEAATGSLRHSTVVTHRGVPISADYEGVSEIALRQIGSTAPGGRASTLRCAWTVSLAVERTARAGKAASARHTMRQENALAGEAAGWCAGARQAIERTVAARQDRLQATMMALVAQDRAAILAEADRLTTHGEG